MKRKTAEDVKCNTCRDSQYMLTNEKGKVYADACKCFACESCQGTGKIFEEDADSGIARIRECECADFSKKLQLFNQAGIPGKFVHESLDTYDGTRHRTQKDALTRSRTFIKEFVGMKGHYSQGLIFMGDPGLGKTHLAVSIIKELVLKHGFECKFVDFFELLRDIRHGYGESISESEFISPYVGVKVLVIDELAMGRNTDWELTVLDHFISTRYNDDDKVTLATTNFNDKPVMGQGENKKSAPSRSLEEKIGSRIFSRLMEMCKKVHLQGRDSRQT